MCGPIIRASDRPNISFIIAGDPLADLRYWSNLTICYALKGERNLVETTIEKVRNKSSLTSWQFRNQVQAEMHFAIAYLVLGDHANAIEILETASKMDSPILLNRELDLWFIFDRLRGKPRFDALLED